MWKPAERIKYTAVEDDWPSASEAQASLLFSPLQVGPMAITQRTWVPAMVPWRSNEEGEVTEDVLQWYRRFALGKPGVIVVEATGIRDTPSGPLLRIGDDRYVPGLKKLADVVREASDGQSRLLIQIIDFLSIRRRPDPDKFLQRFLSITAAHRSALGLTDAEDDLVREALLALPAEGLQEVLTPKEWEDMQLGYRERVTDTQIPAIAELPQTLPGLFARAASRAEQAGFDGVELHYAHAYTMASFLSATNTRTDGYGGDRQSRARLPLEVYAAVREATGPEFAVGCRFLSDEIVEQGNRLEDACYFGKVFAEAGMDFLSLSHGLDGDPIKYLCGNFHSFVYVDYGISSKELEARLNNPGFNGYHQILSRKITAKKLSPDSWQPLSPSRHDGDPERYREDMEKPFVTWSVFQRDDGLSSEHGAERFSLLFLCADGVAAFQALYLSNQCFPLGIAIIQPGHGFGGNWTDFTDPAKSLATTLIKNPSGKPQALLYGGLHKRDLYRETCWPQYSKHSCFLEKTGGGSIGVWQASA